MSDEAKNAFESLIYSLRDWLRDDDNEKYVDEAEREALFTKLDDGEEWLYDEGANVSYTKYQEKSYELTVLQTKFNNRKEQHSSRDKMIPQIRDALEASRSQAHMIREAMPWVTEQEQQDLVDKCEEMRDWIEKKMAEQEKLSIMEEPAFTMDQVNEKMAKVTKFAKKIFGKKKPKEKKVKVEEIIINDEEFDDEVTKEQSEKSDANTDDTTTQQDE